ncbi:MAG: cytochrome c biogenesis protein CcdC [Polyangiales bacterium]
MDAIPHSLLLMTPIAGAIVVMSWRMRETNAAVTARIVDPPLAMSTGFFMRSWRCRRGCRGAGRRRRWLTGALVPSWPLARSSKLTRVGDEIRMVRSRAFLGILVGLVVVLASPRGYLETVISPLQTGSIFFLLAFGMIARWRAGMYAEFQRLRAAPVTDDARDVEPASPS